MELYFYLTKLNQRISLTNSKFNAEYWYFIIIIYSLCDSIFFFWPGFFSFLSRHFSARFFFFFFFCARGKWNSCINRIDTGTKKEQKDFFPLFADRLGHVLWPRPLLTHESTALVLHVMWKNRYASWAQNVSFHQTPPTATRIQISAGVDVCPVTLRTKKVYNLAKKKNKNLSCINWR